MAPHTASSSRSARTFELWGDGQRREHPPCYLDPGIQLAFRLFPRACGIGNFQLALRLVDEVGKLVHGAVIRFGLSYFAGKERTGANTTSAFLTGTQLITAGTTPLFAGIALVANDFIPLVFGSRWEASIPLLQIIAISWIVVFQRILIGLVLRARGQQAILVSFAACAAAIPLISCAATAQLAAIYGVIGFASRRFFIAPFVTLAIRRGGVAEVVGI
jgi:O-antigen/teichoic acid export membrane protein